MILLLVFHALTQWNNMLKFSTFEWVISIYPNYVLEHVTQKTLLFLDFLMFVSLFEKN